MSLINKKELQEQFLLENRYGLKSKSDQEMPWPRTTILLYCLKTYEAPNSAAVQGKPRPGCSCKTENLPVWYRLDNESRNYKLENGETKEVDAVHAEVKMAKQVIAELGKMDPKPRKIDVALVGSYSPCNDCADVLIDLKKYVQDGMNIICNIKVKFSSFYNCHLSDKSNNLPGLCKLLKNSISLETFSGADDWNWFLKSVLNMAVDIDSLIGLSDERKEREAVDDEILHGIKFHMETDGRPMSVPFGIGNSATLKDAQFAVKDTKRNIAGAINAAANRLKNLDIDIKTNNENASEDASISICIPSVYATLEQLSKPGFIRRATKRGNNESNEQQQQDKTQRDNGHEENYRQRRGNRGNGNRYSGNRQRRAHGYRGQEQIVDNYDEVDNGQFVGYQQNYRHQGRSNRHHPMCYDQDFGY